MRRHLAILSLLWLFQQCWQAAALSLPLGEADGGLLSRQHHHDDIPGLHPHAYSKHNATTVPHVASHDAHVGHHHSGPVLFSLNETAIELQHGPRLASYLTHDFNVTVPEPLLPEHQEDWDALQALATGREARPWLMGVHVVAMTLAFFGVLPFALALRIVGHSLHHAAHGAFLVSSTLGWVAGTVYKAATPDLYPGSVHTSQGHFLLSLCIILAALDYIQLLQGVFVYLFRSSEPRSLKGFWRSRSSEAAYENEDYESVSPTEELLIRRRRSSDETATDEPTGEITFTSPFAAGHKLQHQLPTIVTSSSLVSEHTVYGSPLDEDSHKHHVQWEADEPTVPPWAANVAESKSWRTTLQHGAAVAGTVIRRLVVLEAYVVTITGIVTYIGFGRGNYINTCLAHIIKGSIFFLYGLITFSRYIGAFADCGWAWNAPPEAYSGISAEMVECFVVFLYGVTNTWMERLGAAPGSPYTVKQIQHISIAVMYWFAGLAGIILESKRARRFLSGTLLRRSSSAWEASSKTNLNPLPAIVIGITGLAMAAHHQDYQFQVSIHSLWGILLAGGSVFRCLTYIFLWVQPPTTSEVPSRPPTELLAAFGYTAGGIVFMLSDEEIAFAAMRAGYDDMMAFLNLTIALVSFVFCWILIVLTAKGCAAARR